MARKILIIAEDSSKARELATQLAPLGAEVEAHRSIRSGLASLIATQTDVVIVDIEPGAGTGLDAAEAVREVDIRVPLVLLGNAGKQGELLSNVDQDRQSRLGGVLLDKPFGQEELRQAVVRALASSEGMGLTPGPSPRFTPGPGRPPEGSLKERPPHLLLGHLWKRKASGRLELHGPGGSLTTIDLHEGRIVAAADSRMPGKASGEIAIASCGLPEGRWVFHSGVPVAGARGGSLHPLPLATAGVARAYPPTVIRSWLQRHAAESIVGDPSLSQSLAEAGLAGFELPRTGEDAARRLSEAELAQLFTWMAFGLVRFGPPPAPTRDGDLSPAERQEIEAEWRRLSDANHYQALGVAPGGSDADIKKAYHMAARRWHADTFAGRELGSVAPLVDKIFLRISEAWQALDTSEKRAEYDVFLDRKAKGLPTDVESVLAAEEAFQKARALHRIQRYAEAEALLRQAVRLNPAEAEFWAYLGACSYRLRGSAAVEEAREAFARARALIPQSLVTEYLEAQLEIGEGDLVAAERRLKKILAEKPDHTEAMRDLRNLRERKQKEADTGRGFFGKLLKRK